MRVESSLSRKPRADELLSVGLPRRFLLNLATALRFQNSELEQDGLPEQDGIPLNLALAAVRLAQCFEQAADALASLNQGKALISIEVPSTLMPDVAFVLRYCVMEGAKAYQEDWFDYRKQVVPKDPCFVIFSASAADRDSERANRRARRALHARVSIVGISPEPQRLLPADLVRSLRHQLTLPSLDMTGLALVIETVTGKQPSATLPADILANVETADLVLVLHPSADPDAALLELQRLVRQRLSSGEHLPSFSELSGYGAAGDIAAAVIEDLTAFRLGRIGWTDLQYTGLLLHGQPGTGKTMLAKVIAREAGLPLIVGSLAAFQAHRDGHLGHCLAALRENAAKARSKAPCVWFIDEIDSFGSRAQFSDAHRDYSTQVVNALLELLDGAVSRTGIFVIGATNSLDRVDEAIRRPGRLDYACHVAPPSPEELARILRHRLGADLPATISDADLVRVAASGGPISTGADATAWARRARATARRNGRDIVLDDLLNAARLGRPTMSAEVVRRVAVHEAGHALLTLALGRNNLGYISIHHSGGATKIAAASTSLRDNSTIEAIHAQVAILLAGRAAEKLVLGSVSAGAMSDLMEATRLLCAAEGSFGLGTLSHLCLGHPDIWNVASNVAILSKTVRSSLDKIFAETLKGLQANRQCLDELIEEIAKRHFVSGEEAADLVKGRLRPFEIEAPGVVPDTRSLSIFEEQI